MDCLLGEFLVGFNNFNGGFGFGKSGTSKADSGKHGGSTGGSPYNMYPSDRCSRCSAVVDTGAPVPTDGLRPPMAEGHGLLWRLQQQPFYQTSVPRTILSGTASLQTGYIAKRRRKF